MTEINENKAYYWLSLSGMTAKKLNAVLSFYAPLELWERIAGDGKLRAAMGENHAAELLKYHDIAYLDEALERLKNKNIRLLTLASDDYPEALRQKEVSPPPVLYYKGDLSVFKKPCVAIVGTRAASRYGKDTAEAFARDLASAGVTVVSGLATGIDTFAHGAALDFGTTAAVLGGGFDYVSPYSLDLFQRIAQSGVVLTEYAPAFCPTKYSFPERNRIISGLSKGVVVIEAGKPSGALITADYALEQGREVYAVPGNINSPKSAGTNGLIKDGNATFVISAADVLSDLRLKLPQNDKKTTFISLDIYEQKIYNLLQSGKTHFDELLTNSGFNAGQLSSLLFSLEMRGIIRRLESNNYCLAHDIS